MMPKKWWIQNRQNIINTIYQELLLGSDISNVEQDLMDKEADEDYINVIKSILENKDSIISKIIAVITNDWAFDRLHILSQAALICGAYEILILEKPKAIIIDTYVEIMKSISDPKTSKLINALLDKI